MEYEFKVKKIIKDKKDRATFDKVLNPKTVRVLQKLQDRKLLIELEGCISSGKEANIYIAKASTKLECKYMKSDKEERIIPVVIKIFRTSKLEFRSREKYIEGERRFQTYCITNPRKLIKIWAEKEVRNLKRLNQSGIPSPRPIYLKNNIIIMEMIENNGEIAPRLKDTNLDNYGHLYKESINLIERLYRKARLVHSDFSEYNILYSKKLYLIDMGQAIETNQDNSDAFLIMDLYNMNNYFEKKGCDIVPINKLYEDITGKNIPISLKNIEINPHSFIPGNMVQVRQDEDYKSFIKEDKEYESSEEDSIDICNELEKMAIKKTKGKKIKETKEEVKERRRVFKEMRKEKRMGREKKKDKNKKIKSISKKKKRTLHR